MRKAHWFVLISFVCALVQGCASSDKTLTVSNWESVPSIEIARSETPSLHKGTAKSLIAGAAVGAGLLGFLVSQGIESASGKALTRESMPPDFGKLIAEGLAVRIAGDLPGCPKVTLRQQPIDGSYKHSGPSYILLLKINALRVDGLYGFQAQSEASIQNPAGEVVWEKHYSYKSTDFSRPHELSELEAENGKLFREEVLFAADKTVSDFVSHLVRKNSAESKPK